MEDDVKHWVKRAVDLLDGSLKIIKLVFFEKFTTSIGGVRFECFRSPHKEAKVLDLVSGHKNFMQGHSAEDEKGNLLRVIAYIYGQSLHELFSRMSTDHETYFHEQFPGILDNFVECVQAIRYLHEHGQKHGDIRRDHILIERETGTYKWIDFDFNYNHPESLYGYDLFGLGNVLAFLTGMGDILLDDLRKANHPALSGIEEDDLNIVFKNRVINLKKVYPYIPESLNRILMHFSMGANLFYAHTSELLEDLGDFLTGQGLAIKGRVGKGSAHF
jgi:serine/threonine protein kinase